MDLFPLLVLMFGRFSCWLIETYFSWCFNPIEAYYILLCVLKIGSNWILSTSTLKPQPSLGLWRPNMIGAQPMLGNQAKRGYIYQSHGCYGTLNVCLCCFFVFVAPRHPFPGRTWVCQASNALAHTCASSVWWYHAPWPERCVNSISPITNDFVYLPTIHEWLILYGIN